MNRRLTIAQKNILLHKTATFLEVNPSRYDFGRAATPTGEDGEECGCMLAWMNFFLPEPFEDDPEGEHLECVAQLFGFLDEGNFYSLCGKILGNSRYHIDAASAATCLRELANTYYPINLPAREPDRNYSLED